MPLSDWINLNPAPEATSGYSGDLGLTADKMGNLSPAAYAFSFYNLANPSQASVEQGIASPYEQYQQYQRSFQPGNVSTIEANRPTSESSVSVNPAVAGIIGPTNISATGQTPSVIPANIFSGPIPLNNLGGTMLNTAYNLGNAGLNYIGNLGVNQVALGGLPEGNVRLETGYNPTYPNYLQNVSLQNVMGNPSGISFDPSLWSPESGLTAKEFATSRGLGENAVNLSNLNLYPPVAVSTATGTGEAASGVNVAGQDVYSVPARTDIPSYAGGYSGVGGPLSLGTSGQLLGPDATTTVSDPFRVPDYRLTGPLSLGDISGVNQVPALFDTSNIRGGAALGQPVVVTGTPATATAVNTSATTFATTANTSTATSTENVFTPSLGTTVTGTPLTSSNAPATTTFATTANTRSATEDVFRPELGVTATGTPTTSATSVNTSASTFGTTANTRTTTGPEDVFRPELGVTATGTPTTSSSVPTTTSTFGTTSNTRTSTVETLPTYTVSDTRFTTANPPSSSYSTSTFGTNITDTVRPTATATIGTTSSSNTSATSATGTSNTVTYSNTGDSFIGGQTTGGGGTLTTTGMPTERNFERELTSSLDTLSGKQQQLLDYYNKIYQQFMPETLKTASSASLAQLAADQAKLQRIQAGQLNAEDVRQAQQGAREAYAARGQLMGPGAVSAEILNREAIRQQRENEARAGYNASMQNLLNTANLQTGNIFQPVSSLISNTFNPLGQYPQDVYNTNFNAMVAKSIADANNAAAIEAAKYGAAAQQKAAYLSAAGNVLGKMDWKSLFGL